MGGKDVRSIKRALRKEFGFSEAEFIKDADWLSENQKADDYIGQTLVKFLGDKVVNLDGWKQLAFKDRDAYSKALNRLLSAIKIVLNRQCGIQSNRPAVNQQRDELIVTIKRSRPHFSYAQVAREYGQAAGKKIAPNEVERIYKRRCESELNEWITALRPDLELAWLLKLFNIKICLGHDAEASTDK